MIEEVKNAFTVRLEEKDWLDDTTKERCKEKVEAITQMVAYPDQIDNDTYLNELYTVVGFCTALCTVMAIVIGLISTPRSTYLTLRPIWQHNSSKDAYLAQ